MNVFDLPLLLGPLLCLMMGRRCGRWGAALLALGLLLHLSFGLPRWQLWPAFLAAACVFTVQVRFPQMRRREQVRRRGQVGWGLLTALLSLLSLGLSWAFPLFRLPVPSGPQNVGTQVLHGGQGQGTLQLWYPTAQTGGRRAPYLFDAPVAAALARSVGLPGFAFGHLRRLPTHAFLNAPPSL